MKGMRRAVMLSGTVVCDPGESRYYPLHDLGRASKCTRAHVWHACVGTRGMSRTTRVWCLGKGGPHAGRAAPLVQRGWVLARS